MTNNRNVSTANARISNSSSSSANLLNASHGPKCSGIEGHDRFSTIQPVQETETVNTNTKRSFNHPISSFARSSFAIIYLESGVGFEPYASHLLRRR